MDDGTVAAVVVTFNRRNMLRLTLRALLEQTRAVDEVIVVDNASRDGTAELLAAEFPEARHLALPDNTGPAGGFAAGMELAARSGHRWLWLFNDDDRPLADALERLLPLAERLAEREPLAMLGSWLLGADGKPVPQGYRWRHRYRPVDDATAPPDGAPYAVDGMIFAGVLVTASLVREIGLPRRDYFMMFEEVEYCLRARAAGKAIYALPRPLTVSLHEGSGPGQDAAWRGYYQTRNQLAMALERRSAAEVVWWAVRQAKFVAAALLGGEHRLEQVGLRVRGAWHGLRGVRGRTIDPATAAGR